MTVTNAELRPAVFLDRDGTLIEDRGHLARSAEVVFYSDTVDALRKLQDAFMLFIVTNQSGVADGVITIHDVERVNAYVVSRLAETGVRIAETYVCPHRRSDECVCIKPKPYFLHKATGEHCVDLRRSFVVGDHPHDVQLARNAGARGVYVLTGHGAKHLNELSSSEVTTQDIAEAAQWILSHYQT